MEETFLKAVEAGQCETVRTLLDQGHVELDHQDAARDGNSALHLAVTAKRNKLRLIELLLDAGADCNLRNHRNLTPAEHALERGCQHVAEQMLHKELDGLAGDRAVLRLIGRGSVELLKLFLEKRAFDIHTKMKLLKRSIDELSVKGVLIGEPMRVFLEHELIAYSYECPLVTDQRNGGAGPAGDDTGSSSKRSIEGSEAPITGDTEAARRIELVLSYTKYLSEGYDGENLSDLDDEFVVRLRAICECLYFLDGHARRSGARGAATKWLRVVPLTEVTYLASVFLGILEKKVGFEIYKLVLNRSMLVSYLQAVSETLAGLHSSTDRSPLQWTPQLFLDLIACIHEHKLSQYVARRRRASADLQRISTQTEDEWTRSEADRALLQAEVTRGEFVALAGRDPDGSKWGAAEYVAYLRSVGGDDHQQQQQQPLPTVSQLWHRRHPKLRLSKRQVAYAASRRELLKIRARRLDELSRNKAKQLEKELTGREFQAVMGGGGLGGRGGTIRRRNRAVFRAIRRTHEQLRQMHTIKRIASYVENALVIDLDDQANESLCLMAIKRVLQVLAEAAAAAAPGSNTTDQPRSSTFARTLENLLEHILEPLPAREAADVRESFSSRCSAAKYFNAGRALLTLAQAKLIQERLRAVYRFCLYVINIHLIEAFKTFLGTAYRLRSAEQLRSYARYIGEHNLHTLAHIKFEHVFYDERETGRIVQELKRMYLGMTNELKLLSFIEKNIHFRFYHMQYHQTRLRVTLANFAIVYRAMRANPDAGCVRRLLHSYLHQSYQKYDISRSISISDANLALKELLRPYSSISENEETLQVVQHLEQLQRLMDPDCLFGIRVLGQQPTYPSACANSCDHRYQALTRTLLQQYAPPSPLSDEEQSQLHEKLKRTYYENVFQLHNRQTTMEDFYRSKGLLTTTCLTRYGSVDRQDEELMQERFDAKVNELVELVEKLIECAEAEQLPGAIAELPAFVQFALEFGLQELLEVLSSVGVIDCDHDGDRQALFHSPSVALSGSRLRTFLAGGTGAMVLEALCFKSNATIFLNAIVFKRHSFRLYAGNTGLDDHGHETEPVLSSSSSPSFGHKFSDRLQWLEEQRQLFDAVRRPDCEVSELRSYERAGAVIGATRRFGSLLPNELCHYALIDCAIVGDFRAMIDLLAGDLTTDSCRDRHGRRARLLEYLLRRTAKSHFMVGRLDRLSADDRRMLVLYLCVFLGDVPLFRTLLARYEAYDQLHLFVHSDDHAFVERLLAALPDEYDWGRTESASGMTLLQKLVNAGNLPAVQRLMGRMTRSQLDSLCRLKYSAINLAARLNLIPLVTLLADASVNVNVMSEDEKLPAFWLIQYGNDRSIVRRVIDERTELTAFSSELCLLHRAIEYDNEDVVRYLLEERQVDPARIYSNCNNVLHVAAGFDRVRLLGYLLAKPNLRKLVNNGNLVKNTPLNVACKERHLRSARVLLEVGGASTEPTGEYGLNALAFALYTNNGRLVRLLLRHGATIGAALSSDFQPINMAIRHRNIRLLELLLRNGVDIDSAPLCFLNAVASGSRELLQLLIERGAKHVNHRDEFCQTALHLCVERDEYEMARELIRYGAQINAKNRAGMTPLHLAVQRGNVRLVQLLLLDRKCSVDELNYQGETPLIRAVVSNNLALVKILLNNGASIERLRNSDPPVLLYLVQENHEQILDYLLEHYSQFDANEQDAYGNSLLYVATQHNHINIVKLLVDKYGARRNPANHKKLTPLMIARAKEYNEIFHFLEARLVEE
ncbi:uncharacterized protein LOC118468684 [Anopheles albimanus]|uniref:Uncharacterized protein n=1 Tax=Anopheles albimanus TaxID=7167 RepID=A0A182F5W7_ANOAL|nr:uncharacterized protein LOC118468684 [Anopheles albimanus]XP_035795689.1 uncharacterized protein LOC118468684 [Anopheles albimanus]XP_035795690.1 uncharacterized protein LOC118468684 [Anopheles albimanus]XP_035795691.1 uncharacterized protein LOC118468684 [Anopheles albimanus]